MAERRKQYIFKEVEIIDAGSEGKAVAKVDNKVIFIPFVVPGDVVDIKTTRKKKSFFEGIAIKFHKYSDKRTEPKCEYFGLCGGCKWQNMSYENQLFYKQKQVEDNLQRIGKLDFPEILPIKGAQDIYLYRNKLEFTFSNKKWLTDYSKDIDFADRNMDGLGFHLPKMFDRIIDIENCYLQRSPSNKIRLAIRNYAIEKGLEFYDARKHLGLLRNLIIRTSTTGDLMVIVVFSTDEKEIINDLLNFVSDKFPEITSLMYIINDKMNDSVSDLEAKLFKGNDFIIEEMLRDEDKGTKLKFKIGPHSFYQTNSEQAYNLYKIAKEMADLSGKETVYDLYTGTGTIANFIADSAKKVIGIEYIPSAIEDAFENLKLNKIENTDFFAGDMLKILTDDFVAENGQPEVIITDPPRAGMHDKVIKQIMNIAPEKIVYISCNPATQARDLSLMVEKYNIEKVQPVDMFPHTHHVENVVLLKRK
ncbi:MAG: 23S rRNA (uracil(1939)-C(5))-methyltransferase RlmD [Bacteroidales bacterium]|nr:23S rRNA (uracil(1939)-C(5))-methyltransferase RlmD [Bacteroidales bacterium]